MARFRRRRFRRRTRRVKRTRQLIGFSRNSLRRSKIISGVHWFKRTLTWGQDTVVSAAFTAGNGQNGGTMTTSAGNLELVTTAASTVGANSYLSMAYTPMVVNLPVIADFANLFDAYQIRKVVFKISPYASVVTNGATNAEPDFSPNLHYVIDHDDATLPSAGEAGIDLLKQYTSYKCKRLVSSGRKPITIVLKPRAQGYVYNGAAVPGMEIKRGTWLDMANLNVAHYGLKGVFEWINPAATESHFFMRCETTYYLKFKGVR